mmetsp:Transcript_26540/g.44347  ORF Transcript_26540/g.44347 Transcript_26540/m.44347 type:complete len:86 (+) Transcript_26540:960-1217(+)
MLDSAQLDDKEEYSPCPRMPIPAFPSHPRQFCLKHSGLKKHVSHSYGITCTVQCGVVCRYYDWSLFFSLSSIMYPSASVSNLRPP